VEANIGDHIRIQSQHVGETGRFGEVIEVRGDAGSPPYVVRWTDGHEGLFFPGPDALVEHSPAAASARRKKTGR
jgi:hypothetical protein